MAKDPKLKQIGDVLYLFSKADAGKLETRLREFGIDINIKPMMPPPGLLLIPESNHDIVVVDLEYCGSEELTALRVVSRIREGKFVGPIIVNGDGNEYSSLLHIAGATHRVSVVHEEKADIELGLAKAVRDTIKDVARYAELVRAHRARGQGTSPLVSSAAASPA